jgi:hypothetical protein
MLGLVVVGNFDQFTLNLDVAAACHWQLFIEQVASAFDVISLDQNFLPSCLSKRINNRRAPDWLDAEVFKRHLSDALVVLLVFACESVPGLQNLWLLRKNLASEILSRGVW